MLFAFDLTPQLNLNDPTFELIKSDNIRWEVHFADATHCTLTAVVLAEHDNLLQIDKDRHVAFDYTAWIRFNYSVYWVKIRLLKPFSKKFVPRTNCNMSITSLLTSLTHTLALNQGSSIGLLFISINMERGDIWTVTVDRLVWTVLPLSWSITPKCGSTTVKQYKVCFRPRVVIIVCILFCIIVMVTVCVMSFLVSYLTWLKTIAKSICLFVLSHWCKYFFACVTLSR